MKKITSIEPQKKNKERMNLFLDDEFAFGLQIDTVLSLRLSVGMELDPDYIEKVLLEEEKNKAYADSLYYLSFRPRSEKEIRIKLKEKEYEQDIIEQVIERLQDRGYLNDEYFAEVYIKDKVSIGKWGKKRVQYELNKKGIQKEMFEEVWEEQVDVSEEKEQARLLAEKKWNSIRHDDIQKKRQQVMGFMLRKGYSYDIIGEIIKGLGR